MLPVIILWYHDEPGKVHVASSLASHTCTVMQWSAAASALWPATGFKRHCADCTLLSIVAAAQVCDATVAE